MCACVIIKMQIIMRLMILKFIEKSNGLYSVFYNGFNEPLPKLISSRLIILYG